jgi:hypothetical protein
MKTPLQQYEFETHRLVIGSVLVTAIGGYLYFAWSPLGSIVVFIGFAGLFWSFLRR